MKEITIPAYYTDKSLSEEQKRAKDMEMIADDFPLTNKDT